MLNIVVPETEFFDDETNTFEFVPETKLQLEHSLVSISKWESKWHKAFLNETKKTQEEIVDYIRCMTITQCVKPIVYSCLSEDNMRAISEYIEDTHTATTINKLNKSRSREIITSELIYYWMISLNIPLDCQKWHLNRLITLIEVCSIKNQPPKKMKGRDVRAQNMALNASRRARLNSKG